MRYARCLEDIVRRGGVDNMTPDADATIVRANNIELFSKLWIYPKALQVLIQEVDVAVRSIFSRPFYLRLLLEHCDIRDE